ncbi:hypothetical protein SARC_05103 [Sphaeroforma arctica JP610]|uniref:tRNA (adenine(58)-N(1))-methyltransferase n=1 Tax=Sphaeroforma arctica JP610 TaxID=667725 RepID=A0A0L0G1E0_9EUKA|nr:hypothetical protein SARC_05103 [Sphaeroforma arctica JP610]KNC82606.1 hypothetical protein SARC_05103 [Sphaeroforma arctica JP610]|eukprot:XP_014156508.1 hypothetical protein SARC_05103 [Sphaeroforma arctica JP610]
MVCTRPTLEKYVELYLKRSATPTYPKDAMAIMFMLDISPGMRVLEAGSGSGALSLYLARCVGERGSVVSVEKREDHSLAARANYSLWAKAHSFPDRIVDWHVGDMSADTEEALRPSEIIRAKKLSKELSDESFDGVALDMAEPGPSLATVARVLKPGRFVVCYLPNITQVLQTLSMVKIQNLNLQVVRTVECQMRNWTFEPNPRIVTKAMRLKEDLPEQIITVARPSHAQDTHTAFLVQFTKTA